MLSAEVRAISIASRNKLRSASLCGAIFEVFGTILGGFGRSKWMPKSTLGTFFFDVFFEGVSTSILGRF